MKKEDVEKLNKQREIEEKQYLAEVAKEVILDGKEWFVDFPAK